MSGFKFILFITYYVLFNIGMINYVFFIQQCLNLSNNHYYIRIHNNFVTCSLVCYICYFSVFLDARHDFFIKEENNPLPSPPPCH